MQELAIGDLQARRSISNRAKLPRLEYQPSHKGAALGKAEGRLRKEVQSTRNRTMAHFD